jgi:cytochrome c peroxidase
VRIRTGIVVAKLIVAVVLQAVLAACAPADDASTQRDSGLAQVGERLFNDPRLGADGRTSCASCHIASLGFSDGKPVSVGAFGRVGTRNAPSLLGLRDEQLLFWDGREKSLSVAVMQPFFNPQEMGHERLDSALRTVASLPEYREVFGDDVREHEVAAALIAYLHSLGTHDSAFDLATRAGDLSTLGDDAVRGMRLFQGKAQCAGCHLLDGPNPPLSDGRFHHASVGFQRIAGNIRTLQQKVDAARAAGIPSGRVVLTDQDVAELGRFAITGRPQDLGAFRTPSLRNVARTAPYMHDGSVATLEQAIEHELYYRGLATGQPIKLTVEEQRQLASFLRTLAPQ